ncbi:MAG TPA: helix-turn-helix domain-containing protein [Sphingomicrobium sp.]|nr:helix-turn-helix domain-containing protein [Sphingomicrobium sp.]
MELLGERWAILVLRELLLGPRRFSELKSDLPGISANVLTQRLTELEDRGLVRKKKLPPPASVQVYEATEWALDAGPILCQLGRWAFRSPRHDGSQPVSPVAIMLSMQTNFDPSLARDFAGTIAFHFGQARYWARVTDRALEVGSGEAPDADATVICSPDDMKPILYGGAPVDMVQVDGNVTAAGRFVRMFSLPPKANGDCQQRGC